MKILRMQATFGRLERAELCLRPGLNVLELPNEGGKSTWCAFLLAMFYGIDTAERASKGTVPDKTRYKPWSGAAMEGRMDLEWQGRRITLERTSRGRVPLGEFRAYETESGQPVRELTAANCGLLLLGVEKPVFSRSAFLRQNGLAVTQDGALERRLSALVSTGEETVSYSETERRLRDWKNACRHNQTGVLPELERERSALRDAEEQLRTLQQQVVTLRAREEEQTAVQRQLQSVLRRLDAEEARRRQTELAEAKTEAEDLAIQAAGAEKAAAGLPAPDRLRAWQHTAFELQARRKAQPARPSASVPSPARPEGFSADGDPTAEARDAAEGWQRCLRNAEAGRRPLPWLGIAGLIAALALLLLRIPYGGIAALALAAAGFGLWMHGRSKARAAEAAAQAKADAYRVRYGVETPEALLQRAARYQEQCRACAEAQDRAAKALADWEETARQLAEAEARFQADLTAAGLYGSPDRAISDALKRRQDAKDAAFRAETARAHYARLAAALPPEDAAPAAPLPAVPLSERYDRTDVGRQLAACETALRETRSALDRCTGRIAAQGDPAARAARLEELDAEIAAQCQRYAALELALGALAEANDALQTRFAPAISRTASALMGRMTGGRYDDVLLDQALSISARETGAAASQPLNRLSCGTGDQLYLAVRLAICRSVLPPETPLILDDALVNFDEARLRQTLALLREEGETRQILLFTCQDREAKCLAEAGLEEK